MPRDRDLTGRPRNARPRDELGRPLPRGSTGVERTPDDLRLPPVEALVEAQRLLDSGRAFQAHEVLEGTWKAAAPSERELWRGLAQLAVGLTHLQRGNRRGARALLRRAADRIAPYGGPPRDNDGPGGDDGLHDARAAPGRDDPRSQEGPLGTGRPYGLAVAELVAWARATVEILEGDGRPDPPPRLCA